MKESRIRGLTAEELEAVAGGAGKKSGWATITTTFDGPGPHDSSSSISGPYGQLK
jgi:hypothetical protein